MHIPQMDVATGEAAKLVISNLQRALAATTSPGNLILAALVPIFGIRWDAQVTRRVTSARLRSVLCSLRNSKLRALTYQRVSKLWTADSATKTFFPEAWTPWRASIERFNLDDEAKLSERVDVIDTFIKLGWGPPSKLALMSSKHLRLAIWKLSKGFPIHPALG